MGKTNLLDAVYYLSFCKSYTNPIDSQIIMHDADVCMIQGQYIMPDDTTEEIFCALKRRHKKQFKRNKKEYDRLSDHIGFIPLVMISPTDNNLIMGGSEERRRFMDIAISQFNKNYLHALVRYNKALQQRNALLKNGPENIDNSLLELLEFQMMESGTFIHNERREFIKEFIPVFNQFYQQISRCNEQVSFQYISQLSEGDFFDLLLANRKRDLLLGHTSVGIHRDEIEMLLDDFPIKKVGSQGQNKTYFVSMKLAQFYFLLKTGSKTPILLLDDIFDRLDAKRVEEIIKVISSDTFGQIFISDTNREFLDRMLAKTESKHHMYSVNNGEIKQIKE